MNFNKNSNTLSVGCSENRSTAGIGPHERDFETTLFDLTWKTDSRFLDMLTQCMQTQVAAYLEEQITQIFDLILNFKFRFRLRVIDVVSAFAKYEIIMNVPSNNKSFFDGFLICLLMPTIEDV
uniref:Uncharacterized protein n=1 Tax=Glossina palpalis gambiensis TaxID=67801 RepID=A0A1B0BXY4_9MUSC